MKKVTELFWRLWRPSLVVLLVAVVGYFVLFNHLGNLVPGYSAHEIATYNSSQHFRDIVAHPVNAPYKIILYGVIKFAPNHLIATRIVASAIGLVACILFFYLVRKWFNLRIAAFSVILLGLSSGLLHSARLGTPDVLLLAPLLLFGALIWLQRIKRRSVALYIAAACLTAAIYIPGFIWFELLGLIFWRKVISRELHRIYWKHLVIAGLLILVLLLPLIRACIIFPKTIYSVFGLPSHLAFSQIGVNLWHALSSIGLHSYGGAEKLIGHAPLLDATQLVLLILGIFVFASRPKLSRSRLVFAVCCLSLVLISLGGPVSITLLLPTIYLFVAAGLYELLHRWLKTFPRNPFARVTGIVIVCCLIFFSVLYQARSYYVAWPHNSATKQTFNRHNL
ncbi:MAG: hypothetical protein ABI220_02710 [Candidatus Saccharimonadales bacterium]